MDTQLQERAMDSNALESERWNYYLSKNTAVDYNGTRINILDTQDTRTSVVK